MPTPPDAITGRLVRSSAAARPSRSGPASVPSRLISVTTTAATPASSKRGSTSSTAVARCPRSSRARPPRRRDRRARPRRAGGRRAARRAPGPPARRVPITTRATPASASAAAAASDRTPPPLCTCTPCAPTAAAIAPTTARFTGSPVRAASRSTTWIHRAPAAANPTRDRDRVVAVDRLLLVVALVEAHAAAAAEVDGRVELDHRRTLRSGRAGRHRGEVGQQRQARASPTSPGGTAWRTRCPGATAAVSVAAVVARGRHDGGIVGHAVREWTKYIHGRSPRPANSGSSGRRSCSVFHCICGRFTPGGIQRTVPGITPRPGAPGSSSERSNSICMPTQMPRNGRPDADGVEGDVLQPGVAQRLHARPKAPTPGSTTPAASAMSPRSAVRRASAPTCSSAFWAERRLPMP